MLERSEFRYTDEDSTHDKQTRRTYHFFNLFAALTASVFVEEGALQPCQAYTIVFLLSVTTNDVLDLKDDELRIQKEHSLV